MNDYPVTHWGSRNCEMTKEGDEVTLDVQQVTCLTCLMSEEFPSTAEIEQAQRDQETFTGQNTS